MIEQINDIVEKEDSAEKLNQMQGVPEKHYVKSLEFNTIVDRVKKLITFSNNAAASEPSIAPGTQDQYLGGDKQWKVAVKTTKPITDAAYTLKVEDFGKRLTFANACVVTLPPGIGRDGLQTTFRQLGNGKITIQAGAGASYTKPDIYTNVSACPGAIIGVECNSASTYSIYGTLELI